MITPSEDEERLIEALRALSPDASGHVISLATRLRDLADGKDIEWSATWTGEDLADVQGASWSRFDEQESEDL